MKTSSPPSWEGKDKKNATTHQRAVASKSLCLTKNPFPCLIQPFDWRPVFRQEYNHYY
jgi:hypothetical protein